jgi:hypothetical protein
MAARPTPPRSTTPAPPARRPAIRSRGLATNRRAQALWLASALAGVAAAPAAAIASPGVQGTRNVALAGQSRGSAYGVDALLFNPAGMTSSQQFAIEGLWQLRVQGLRNGLGAAVMDSLNNPRIALGFGYLFMVGYPRVEFFDIQRGDIRNLRLQTFGHEVFGALSVIIVKNWLHVALKPKYQRATLKFLDDNDAARNAAPVLNAFGLDTALNIDILGFVRIAGVAENVTGANRRAFGRNDPARIADDIELDPATFNVGSVPLVADYPLIVAHAVSVFPLGNPNLSLNSDGVYDFTSYRSDDHVRLVYGGSGEFIAGPVPIRVGGHWDGRGPGGDDDAAYVGAGLGYMKNPRVGGVGVDIGVGVQQQVAGPRAFGELETTVSLHLGIRIHPDL